MLIKDVAPDAEILPVTADLRNENDVEQMIKTTVTTFGRLDYAVNSAGELIEYACIVNRVIKSLQESKATISAQQIPRRKSSITSTA